MPHVSYSHRYNGVPQAATDHQQRLRPIYKPVLSDPDLVRPTGTLLDENKRFRLLKMFEQIGIEQGQVFASYSENKGQTTPVFLVDQDFWQQLLGNIKNGVFNSAAITIIASSCSFAEEDYPATITTARIYLDTRSPSDDQPFYS